MNRREAKRMATRHAAQHLRTLAPPASLRDGDAARYYAALLDLVDELERRGGVGQPVHVPGQMRMPLTEDS